MDINSVFQAFVIMTLLLWQLLLLVTERQCKFDSRLAQLAIMTGVSGIMWTKEEVHVVIEAEIESCRTGQLTMCIISIVLPEQRGNVNSVVDWHN